METVRQQAQRSLDLVDDYGALWVVWLGMGRPRPPASAADFPRIELEPGDKARLQSDSAFAMVTAIARRHGGSVQVTLDPQGTWRSTFSICKQTA